MAQDRTKSLRHDQTGLWLRYAILGLKEEEFEINLGEVMKFIRYTPMPFPGSVLGEVEFVNEDPEFPAHVLCNIVKNKATGGIFVSMPSTKYKIKDGTEKYKNLFWFAKDNTSKAHQKILDYYKSCTENTNKAQELPF